MTDFRVIISDDGFPDLTDTLDVPIYIEQRNDPPLIDGVKTWVDSEQIDNYFHLSDDSVDFMFEIQFNDIDSDITLNENPYDLDNLDWDLNKKKDEQEKRVFASKVTDGFKIDSLFSNFNTTEGASKIIHSTTEDYKNNRTLFVESFLYSETEIKMMAYVKKHH